MLNHLWAALLQKLVYWGLGPEAQLPVERLRVLISWTAVMWLELSLEHLLNSCPARPCPGPQTGAARHSVYI
jgi:hypothetical protein